MHPTHSKSSDGASVYSASGLEENAHEENETLDSEIGTVIVKFRRRS